MTPLEYFPPRNWQDFQEMVLCVAKQEWPTAVVEAYGREGQAQNGIDVRIGVAGEAPIGIQAKKRRLNEAQGTIDLTGGLTNADLDDMVVEAKKFKPALSRLIVATTAYPDTKLQDHAAKISVRHAKAGKFSLEIWFWDRFQSEIAWNADLKIKYYGEIAPRILAQDPTKLYLMLVKNAFNRSAFTTRLEMEDSGDDMHRALADTRIAIVLGILNDREGRRISRASIGVESVEGPVRQALDACVALLDRARQAYTDGLTSGALLLAGGRVRPVGDRGNSVAREVDRFRGEALNKMSEAVATVGLGPQSNYLLVN